uniref:Receptor-like serine/threonine-protein kinase n=1 Tax=Araucaria cunninghamii TaxID=56994 RepID=A0A0D6QTH7_ARACU
MEVVKILCGLILGVWISLCEAKFFVLPSNWTVVNNASLPIYNTEQGTFRAVTDGEGNAIMSEDYRFAFGFINVNSTGDFILSVVLGVNFSSSALGTEVWTANRNKMVAEGAVLKLGSDGDLVLEDSDGTMVWNISTGKTQNKAIAMQETGNLQIYNTTNSSLVSSSSNLVWQSWDHPTHTLLPGQVLKTGYTLVSNLSASNTSQGSYKLTMEPGGMVLYYRSKFDEPYWSLGLRGLDYQGIMRPCFYSSSSENAEAWYTGQELEVSFNGTIANSSSSCSNGTNILHLAPALNDTQYRFMRLDNDGNLRAYRIPLMPGTSNNISSWSSDYGIDQSDKCVLPRVCGPDGVCVDGQCSCPGSGTRDDFQQIQPLDVTQGCSSRTGEPDCTQSSVDHHYLPIEGGDYYLNEFLQPLGNVSTTDECKAMCSSNCSCTAAFFHNSSASCYLANNPLNSLKSVSGQMYMAYIKVQNKLHLRSASNSLNVGSIAGITVGSAAAVLFLCLIIILTIQHIRKVRAKEDEMDDEEMDADEMEEEAFLKTLPGLPPRYTYHELKEATNNFSKLLGTGGFGSVYEGVLEDNSRVAVKRLGGLRQGYKEFRAEVATIGSISHMNLVRLRGFCAHSKQRLLVYELLENGSLDKWLFLPKTGSSESPGSEENNHIYLTWEQRYNVAVGTARGLTYLHEECREPIMHLDIKPQNILLDKNFMAKVADFGMSKLLNDDMTQVVTAVRGTPGYLAPEWLRHSIATKKCDVYSFGMVLLELVSGRKNFDPYASDPRLCYFPAWAMLRALEGKYLDLVDKRLGNNVDREAVIRMTKVAFWCIQDNPDKRPWMSVALKMLEGEWEIPEAPLWLLQRGPEFLEGYGYEPMEQSEELLLRNVGTYTSIARVSPIELSGPR